MAYRIGRLLQVLGFLIVPIGAAGNVLHPESISEKHILLTLFIGATVFAIGRAIQGPGPNQ